MFQPIHAIVQVQLYKYRNSGSVMSFADDPRVRNLIQNL
ncbi:hypothetical protein F383_28742 [Gossypium arboreum]|uniref:Uncharacterized protein n=2 Tax=Gossypium arboreum TaxID=29729 RepID=A0A0B0PDZ7_GOSAR|nr:hypothetical protein F383_28742 [Gossypium arboreum]